MKLGKKFRAFATSSNPTEWLIEAFGGKPSKTGITVTTETSLGLAPVIYAVNRISGHVAQMPIEVKQYNKDGTSEKLYNNTYRLLNKSPNTIMSSYQFKEAMMVHCLMQGNGRAYIERNSNGTPIGLIPILPQNCQTLLVDGQKWHIVTKDVGTTQDAIPQSLSNGEFFKIPDRDVLHIMNTSYNGVWGMHVIDIARDVFGLTQAGQEGAAVTIANSGRPSLMLEAPNGMFRSSKDASAFLENFNEKHEGLNNSGKAGLLKDGMKAHVMPVTSADSQFLEQRKFQREEIALLFGLESIMGDSTGQTYKSISERNTAYINNCLSRWFAKWTQECENKLVGSPSVELEFNTSQLMKGDMNSVADYTMKVAQSSFMTVNEMRNMHGLDPIPEGDVVVSPQVPETEEESAGEAGDTEETSTREEDTDEA